MDHSQTATMTHKPARGFPNLGGEHRIAHSAGGPSPQDPTHGPLCCGSGGRSAGATVGMGADPFLSPDCLSRSSVWVRHLSQRNSALYVLPTGMGTAMNMETWTSRWWEATVVVLAANSVIFGVVGVGNGHLEWAIATGFAPAVLLIASLALRNTWRTGATVTVVAASLAAAAWWWMMYPVALAAVVIVGGVSDAKIGPRRVQSLAAL